MDQDSTGMLIDGIAGSEAIDSSGEILDIGGCDISDYKNGSAVLNVEHMSYKDPENVIGKVVHGHKVFNKGDCEDEREEMFWNQIKLPYIYVKCRLYDGAGHPKAQAIAAQIRDAIQNDERPIVRFSVEGQTLKRSGNRLEKSVLRRLAATIVPCNRSAHSGILHDPQAPKGYESKPEVDKQEAPLDGSWLKALETKKAEDPNFFYKTEEFEFVPFQKALEAGNYNVPPSSLTQGSALSVEDPSLRRRKVEDFAKRAAAVFRDWDKIEPIKPMLKAKLPDADEGLITHFENQAQDYKMKRNLFSFLTKMEQIYEDLHKALNPNLVEFGGKKFKTGTALVGLKGTPHVLIGHDEDHHYGVPEERFGMHTDDDLVKMPMKDQGESYKLLSPAEEVLEHFPDDNPGFGLKDINTIYGVYPEDAGVQNRILGKYAIHDGNIYVLEDHNGILAHIKDGPVDVDVSRFLANIKNSHYLKVVNAQELADGKHPDYVKTVDSDGIMPDLQAQKMTAEEGGTFEYIPHGTASIDGTPPKLIQVRGDICYFDGAPVDLSQMAPILESLDAGVATLRYPEEESAISKTDQILENLLKAEEPDGLLATTHPAHRDHVEKHVLKDTLMADLGIGNLHAHRNFMNSKQSQGGVHGIVNLNDFNHVKEEHGLQAADQALHSTGKALKDAADATGNKATVHRIGEDEFHVHFKKEDHAARFARKFRDNLEDLPHVGGNHRVSASMGFGPNIGHAFGSLKEAKRAKREHGRPKGQSETHVHNHGVGEIPLSPILHRPLVHPMLADLPHYQKPTQ